MTVGTPFVWHSRHSHVLFGPSRLFIKDHIGKLQMSVGFLTSLRFFWLSLAVQTTCDILEFQQPLLIYNHRVWIVPWCDLFILVHTVVSPAVLFMWRAYQWELRPAPLQGRNLPLPGRETVLRSGFTLLLAQTHAHGNKCIFCIGLTALPSLFSLSCRAE